MLEDNLTKSDLNQRKKAVYTKVNFYSCVVAISVAVIDLLLTIINEFTEIPVKVYLACLITMCSVAVLAIIFMAFSFFKLRSLKKSDLKTSGEISLKDEDFCYFKNLPVLEFEMLESALKNNNIEIVGMPVYSGGVTRATAGRADERRVFVRQNDLEKVKEVYKVLFGATEQAD